VNRVHFKETNPDQKFMTILKIQYGADSNLEKLTVAHLLRISLFFIDPNLSRPHSLNKFHYKLLSSELSFWITRMFSNMTVFFSLESLRTLYMTIPHLFAGASHIYKKKKTYLTYLQLRHAYSEQ
jgi:hypothetical protein